MARAATAALAAVLLSLPACASREEPPVDILPSGPGPGTSARMLVSTAELAAALGSPDLVVVQVGKERRSYDEGHVPGARFLPFGALSVKRDGVPGMFPPRAELLDVFRALGVGEASRVVFYDDEIGGWAARGWMAMELLSRGGQAALLDGHLAKWRAEGLPLTREVPEPEPSALRDALDPLVTVELAEVKRLVAEKRADPSAPFALLDARPPEEFRGEKPGEGIARPGHIPGFANLPYTDLVESKENPVMVWPGQLRAIFEGAGARADREVVVACRSGRQASLLYFAARYIGLRVRLYDGSYLEWSADPANPVEK